MRKKYKKYFGKVLKVQDKNSFVQMNLELLCHSKYSNTNKNKLTFKINGLFKKEKDIKYIRQYIKIKDNIVLKGFELNKENILCKNIKCLFNTPLPRFGVGRNSG